MKQRKVTEAQVVEVLERPDLVRPAADGKWYERSLSIGRHLKVVAILGEIRENEFIVKTVAWRDDNEA